MAPPPPGRFAAEIVGRHGIGPAGLSAALDLGLATQVPRYDFVAIPARVPRSPGQVRMVSRAACTKRESERLSPAEVALLEVLRDWSALVELPDPEANDRIARLLDANTIRTDKLVRASATEPSGVRDRLRRLLTDAGRADAASAVRPARSRAANGDLAILS
jgi:hypothetical protein